MTTARTQLLGQNISNTSNATFREWGKWISDNLTAGGQTKTSDTGQIDWSTVAVPSISNYAGYEIRQFTDSLAASYPIVYKLEFGNGGVNVLNAALKMTVGTGSNGSGTITGVLLASPNPDQRDTNTSNTASRMISVDPNRFVFDMYYNGALAAPNLMMERTKDAVYADTNQGVIIRWKDSSGGAVSHKIYVKNFSGVHAPDETQGTGIIPISGTTVDGSNVAVFPIPIFNLGKLMRPTNMFGYRNTDISTDTVFSLSLNGTAQDYIATGQAQAAFAISRNGNSLAVRF
jgi:hypothetical protein